jgi:hypothetical protein
MPRVEKMAKLMGEGDRRLGGLERLFTTIEPTFRSGVVTIAPSSPWSGASRISTMSSAPAMS